MQSNEMSGRESVSQHIQYNSELHVVKHLINKSFKYKINSIFQSTFKGFQLLLLFNVYNENIKFSEPNHFHDFDKCNVNAFPLIRN